MSMAGLCICVKRRAATPPTAEGIAGSRRPRHHPGAGEYRRGRGFRPKTGDPYRSRGKLAAGTTCAVCGLVVVDGVWKKPASGARPRGRGICPACRGIRDDYPGGILKIKGKLSAARREEILNRARIVARQEAGAHPLQRLMQIEESPEETILYFTGEHVPVRVGKALRRDFGGSLSIRYAPDEKFAVAHWTRD